VQHHFQNLLMDSEKVEFPAQEKKFILQTKEIPREER
jgi:hypothetical protein